MTFKMTVESVDKIAGQTILSGHGNAPTYSGKLIDGLIEFDVLPVLGVYIGVDSLESISVNVISGNVTPRLIGKELRSIA